MILERLTNPPEGFTDVYIDFRGGMPPHLNWTVNGITNRLISLTVKECKEDFEGISSQFLHDQIWETPERIDR